MNDVPLQLLQDQVLVIERTLLQTHSEQTCFLLQVLYLGGKLSIIIIDGKHDRSCLLTINQY